MWVKVDDRFPSHEKVAHAASFLSGRDMRTKGGRVLAVWLEGLCLVNERELHGVLYRPVAAGLRWDPNPIEVCEAMAQTLPPRPGSEIQRPGLLVPIDGGWQFHDYHDENFTPEELTERRKARAASGRIGGLASGRARRAKQNGSKNEALCFDFTKQTRSDVLSTDEAKRNPDPDPHKEHEDHRAARGSFQQEGVENPERLLRAIVWQEVTGHPTRDQSETYFIVKQLAREQCGVALTTTQAHAMGALIDVAMLRVAVREVVASGVRGPALFTRTHEVLRSRRIQFAPADVDRAVNQELRRARRERMLSIVPSPPARKVAS